MSAAMHLTPGVWYGIEALLVSTWLTAACTGEETVFLWRLLKQEDAGNLGLQGTLPPVGITTSTVASTPGTISTSASNSASTSASTHGTASASTDDAIHKSQTQIQDQDQRVMGSVEDDSGSGSDSEGPGLASLWLVESIQRDDSQDEDEVPLKPHPR